MIQAIIVDDEQHCTDRLRYLADTYCAGEINIAGTADTIESAFELINKVKPQVVFLDIQVHQQTGFDLLKRYPVIPFQVVFTTAFEQYAIKAFKFSAVDYLLKPIDPDEFKHTVERLKDKLDKEDQSAKVDLLFQNLKLLVQPSPKITVPTVIGLEFIKVDDIIRCRSDVNYTTIFTRDKKELVVAKTLKEFEGLLSGYNFFRIHNSHLVNLAYIKSYHKGKGGYIQLEDKTELEVSTRRKDEFLLKMAGIK